MTLADQDSFMMEARIPTRKWKTYDLATVVARDEKKGGRSGGITAHIEKEDDAKAYISGRRRRFGDNDSDLTEDQA